MKRLVLAVGLMVLMINVFNEISNQVNAYQLYKINSQMVKQCTFDMANNPELICD